MSRGVRAVPALALFALACLCGLGSALAAERTYFWNDVTHTSTWEEPDVPVAFEDPESGKPYYFDAKTGESTWEFPGAWKEVASDEHGQPAVKPAAVAHTALRHRTRRALDAACGAAAKP